MFLAQTRHMESKSWAKWRSLKIILFRNEKNPIETASIFQPSMFFIWCNLCTGGINKNSFFARSSRTLSAHFHFVLSQSNIPVCNTAGTQPQSPIRRLLPQYLSFLLTPSAISHQFSRWPVPAHAKATDAAVTSGNGLWHCENATGKEETMGKTPTVQSKISAYPGGGCASTAGSIHSAFQGECLLFQVYSYRKNVRVPHRQL